MKITYGSDSDYDNINPYRIHDGKWGGFGEQTWFRGIDKENPSNVFESTSKYFKEESIIRSWYFRIFDVTLDKWRDLTPEESNKYRIDDRKYVKVDWSNPIQMPTFKKKTKNLNLRDITMVQPMTE